MNNHSSYYSRLAPFIREYIYREKWNALHVIQEKAAAEILDGKNHVLIAAGTASGKTEAAFFPVLTVLETLFRAGKKPLVLYVSPLKALINDQAQRLAGILCSGRDGGEPPVPVWRWHGDVDSGGKNRFIAEPSGILLITPESLEALLLRRNRELGRIFRALLFAVIDEVHVFMGSDRGSQLVSQLERIGQIIRDARPVSSGAEKPAEDFSFTVRRIGLSATLGDYEGGRHWLGQGSGLDTALVEDAGGGKQLSLALDYHSAASFHNKGAVFYQSIYEQCRNKRAIVFTNSRLEAEECAASLGALAKKQNEPDIFQVHHGNVSAMLRGEAEEQLKSAEGPHVICATSTLELGIDIGDLDRIIQLGPPSTVSAFVQRLGRSGRRSGRAEMYFGIPGAAKKGETLKGITAIPWELLRTIAVIQLYLEEKWIEPPAEKKLPFSLLVHQTLALLASLGEHSVEALGERVLSLTPFRKIKDADFRTLIRSLEESGHIGTTEEGTLILGLEGERLVNRHSFYAVFPGEETFRVLLEGREIGTVHFAPDPMSVLAVGGKRWIVQSVDAAKKEIWVTETGDGGSERLWRGRGGETHRRIAEKMREILKEKRDEQYPYLSDSARKVLEAGRRAALLHGITEETLIAAPENERGGTSVNGKNSSAAQSVYLFPWTGNAGMRTIAAVLGNSQNKKTLRITFLEEDEWYFCIATNLAFNEFRASLRNVCRKSLDPRVLTEPVLYRDIPYTDKYDYLLPPRLLAKQYAANVLDTEALERLLAGL